MLNCAQSFYVKTHDVSWQIKNCNKHMALNNKVELKFHIWVRTEQCIRFFVFEFELLFR